MNLDRTPELRAFRADVRRFLAENLPAEMRLAARASPTVFVDPEIGRRWIRVLREKCWLAYHWPVQYGGTGWSPAQCYIFEQECALADAPVLPGMGLKMLGSVLCAFGTDEQRQYYLPRILDGEHYWCQGFSEPEAGSDLASLKTRAVRTADGYLVTGSKTWTTHAQFADHMFCLARTETGGKPQQGISFLLVNMRQPGVRVQPITGLAGDQETNMVFLDDVRVPLADRVGAEGDGWSIAKFLLEHERAGTCYGPRLLKDLAWLRGLTRQLLVDEKGSDIPEDVALQYMLARLELEAQALEMTELRVLDEIGAGQPPGPQASLVKIVASELRQCVDRLALAVHGYEGLELCTARPLDAQAPARLASPKYLNSRAWSIFGGTNEIQRTIIARSVLGL